MQVSITVDMEHDCRSAPASYRGVIEGTPQLLNLFRDLGLKATFFTTGDVARQYPDTVRAIVREGHELGCHGDSHDRFSTMSADAAQGEIEKATLVLSKFDTVTSFRAPNLDFPDTFLRFLIDAGYRIDSSQARYKRASAFANPSDYRELHRIPVSTMPSVIRLPGLLRRLFLGLLREPVVLYVHPWEFVDMTKARIPYDCRYRTGAPALESLTDAILYFRSQNAIFRPMRELSV